MPPPEARPARAPPLGGSRTRRAPASPCRTSRSPLRNSTSRAMGSSFRSITSSAASVHSARCGLRIAASCRRSMPTVLLGVVAAVAREARPHVEAYVALDSSLERDLGLDSLARVELVLRLEREFAASLPEQALASSETPRDLLRFLLAGAGQAPQAPSARVASLVQSEGVRPPDRGADADRGARVPRRAPARPPDRVPLRRASRSIGSATATCGTARCSTPRASPTQGVRSGADGGDHAADVARSISSASTARCSPAASRCRSTRRRASPPSRTT